MTKLKKSEENRVKLRTSFDIAGKETVEILKSTLHFPWIVRVSDMKSSLVRIYVLEKLESFTRGKLLSKMLKSPILLNLFLFIVISRLLIFTSRVSRFILVTLECDFI